MATNHFSAETYDEAALLAVAAVIGPNSAAAKALAEAKRRRANGEEVCFYRGIGKDRGSIFVGPPLPKGHS